MATSEGFEGTYANKFYIVLPTNAVSVKTFPPAQPATHQEGNSARDTANSSSEHGKQKKAACVVILMKISARASGFISSTALQNKLQLCICC